MIYSALSSLCLVALLFATTVSVRAQAANDAQAAIDDSIRRQALTLKMRQILTDAQATQKRNETAAAAKKYEDALALIAQIGANVEPEKKLIVGGLIEARLQLADQAMRRTDYGAATLQLDRVLKLDPRNVAGLEMKKANNALVAEGKGRRPTDEQLNKIPEVVSLQYKTGELVQNGKLLYEMGRMDEAQVELKKAIKLDPDNKAAFYYLDLVLGTLYARESRQRESSSKEMLMQVEQEWPLSLSRDLLEIPNPYAKNKNVNTSPERQVLYKKLKSIKLGAFQVDGLPLSEVVKQLSDEAKKRDPDLKGVNFLVSSTIDPPAAGAVDPNGVPLPPAAALDLGAITIKIPTALNDLTLEQALDVLTKISEPKIKYSVEDWGIILSPKAVEPTPLYTRIFKLDPNTFYMGLQNVTSQAFGAGGGGGGGGNNNRNNNNNGNNGNNNNGNNGFNNNGNNGFNNNNNNNNGNNGNNNNGNNNNGGGGSGGGSSYATISIAGGGANGQQGNGRGGQGGQGGGGAGGGTNAAGSGGLEFVTTVTQISSKIAPVRAFFATAGVDLGEPKAVFWNDRTGVLMIRATMQDLDLVEKAIQVMNIAPPQLTIKAKFLEITQDDTRQLGFDWYLGNFLMRQGGIGAQAGTAPSYSYPGGTSGSAANPSGVFPGPGPSPGIGGPGAILPAATDNLLTGGLRNGAPALATVTGILTDPQFRFVVRALEQRGGVDLLSCPQITTLSARQAQIKVVDIKYVVTDLNINQTTGQGGIGGIGGGIGGAGGVASTIQPTTEPFEIGPVLDVIPYVMADGYTIQMTIIPTLKEFLGYDSSSEFVSVVQSIGGSAIAAPIIQPTPLPKFRLRQLATDCMVWDGQTVLLGGLIAEDVQKTRDKVPVLGDLPMLGRFFRSESNTTKKKNLVIFVTPTIIDPAGNRMHSDDELPFAQHSIPVQKTLTP